MKRFILFILAFFLFFTNTPVSAASALVKKEIQTVAADGFNLKSTLQYPKNKAQKEYKTVVLLHSLGYNSQWWGDLPKLLNDNGYAVLMIDLRGHGKSVYNSKLTRTSWKRFTNAAYAKYPSDVIKIIESIKEDNPKKIFFNEWAIVGSDIGASSGILASDKMTMKPKTIVILSPVVETRSLYIPVSIAQLENVDFLSISGDDDTASQNAEKYLKKFAQNEFAIYTSPSKASGMVMLKNDESLTSVITEWIKQYLK